MGCGLESVRSAQETEPNIALCGEQYTNCQEVRQKHGPPSYWNRTKRRI